MDLISKEEIIKKYPYLEKSIKNTLIISKNEEEDNKLGKRIRYYVNGNLEVATDTLLNKLINDDRYYYYVKQMIGNDITEFNISAFATGEISYKVTFTKMEVIKGIEALLDNHNYSLDEEHMRRLIELKNSATIDELINKYDGRSYEIKIDNRKVSIPIIKMLNFLQLPDEYYNISMNLECLSGVKKEYFLYALINFINGDKILDKYDFTLDMIRKTTEIKYCEKIDIQALNKIVDTDDLESQKITIDSKLHDEILNDMPQDLNNLEKAIYIYIKMCKMLTYDEEFYVKGQCGDVLKKHAVLNSTAKITPIENNVVCYEFNAIYAKLLRELGINYRINRKGIHANLTFRCEKFIIDADSTVSIIRGDLFQSKLGLPLNGLECKNINENTRNEFDEALERIYKLVLNNNIDEQLKSFEDVVDKYKETTEAQTVSLSEKVSIIIQKVKQIQFATVDVLSYIKHLETVLFSLKERERNIRITIIKNNMDNNFPRANVIFTLNNSDIESKEDENIYIHYDLNGNMTCILKEELQRKFMSKEFSYIRNDSYKIPGIKIGRELIDERFERVK